MDTFTIILLSLFAIFLLFIFGFLTLMVVHIRPFAKYSPKIIPVIGVLFGVIILISCFGIYKIITGKHSHINQNTFINSEFNY